jgi:hypothetical protein
MGLGRLMGGEFAEAIMSFAQSRTLTEEVGDRHHLNTLNIEQAETMLYLGQYDEAYELAQLALTTAEEIGIPSHRGQALVRMGMARLVQGDCETAERLIEQSAAVFRESQLPFMLDYVFAGLGYAARGAHGLSLAQGHLADLLRLGTDHQFRKALVVALPLAALLAADAGEVERAFELYAVAARYPHIANSRWYEDLVGKPLAAKAAILPPDVVQHAQESGRSRDIDQMLAELQAESEAGWTVR